MTGSNPVQQPRASEPMRIGYLLRMYPRFSQTFVVNEILELERQGVDIHIASLRKPTDGKFHESLSRVRADVAYVPEFFVESRSKILKAAWESLRKSPAGYVKSCRAMIRHAGADSTDLLQAALVLKWAKKRKIKHVHVHFGTHEATVAYLAHLMGGLSYSLTLHAFDIFRDNVDRPLLVRKINASRFTVTVSEYNRDFMLKNLPDVKGEKILVNYNGIDLERFHPNGAQRQPNTVFGVGRLIEKKGFIHLIRAIGRLRDEGLDVRCTIAGDGPEEKRLLKEIKRLEVQDLINLAGPLSQDRVRELLEQSSCFALPCVQAADGNVDALPTVLLEALAAGCPAVSTSISGVPEIIENECSGLLVEPGNDRKLADAIKRVLQTPNLSRSLATGGRQRAESRFDIQSNVARMREHFHQTTSPTFYSTCADNLVGAPQGKPDGEPTRSAEAVT